ncbi:MAG: hypothetical protein A2390_00800 [Candidatus Liptonbacteria bacterium RIFOXYB1_FULL_36_10]|uniref:dolichyl-phosphate beta-glucosyltransferase n=1 Tax=Candidatus Liptonbacteria bacterium RIFOXYB1_FULL_36_10 TaxID=1798654 RepID=A0A1G2CPY4_9BACT|nr:MAG: hypothetical protein A2390_00800 [Candidatus Liptonbacteria bacterium RIFOXYB1_FULL_36_10]
MKNVYLSIIIPAYNEAKRLPLTLIDIDKKVREMDLESYEILVVDDGSKDETVEVTKRFLPIISNLKILESEKNHGKGAVVRKGMLEAHGAIRIFMDADNSTTIDQFLTMRPYFEEGAQVVIGSRDVKGAKLDPPQPFYKRILGNMGNLFIQALVLPGIWDTQCGFKAFTAKAAEEIFSQTKVDRWAFDIEALVLAKKMGYEIKEIPVHWVNDLRSRVKLSAYMQVLLETVSIWWRIKRK